MGNGMLRRERSRPARTESIIERAWIWSVVGYTILRFVVAWGAFSEHGANVWVFGLLDVGTAWPYAKAIALVSRRAAEGEWRRIGLPAGVALVSFMAPYAYLWVAAGRMPAGLKIGLAVFVAVIAIAALAGIVTRVRKLRLATEAEPVIDLTDRSRSMTRPQAARPGI